MEPQHGKVNPVGSAPASQPLSGRTVLVTRPAEQSEAMIDSLRRLGAAVLCQPAIEITEPHDWGPVDAVISRLDTFDWVVFSSSNGVHYFLERLLALGRDLRALGAPRLAAIGPATANALAEYHLAPDVQPEAYRAEALADALIPHAKGKRFLLARAGRGREVLAETLIAVGAIVEQVVVYESRDVDRPDEDVARAMAAGEIDWTTVTSSAIARSLVKMLGNALRNTRLAAISPLSAGVLRELGYEPAAVAEEYTTEGVVAAILGAERRD